MRQTAPTRSRTSPRSKGSAFSGGDPARCGHTATRTDPDGPCGASGGGAFGTPSPTHTSAPSSSSPLEASQRARPGFPPGRRHPLRTASRMRRCRGAPDACARASHASSPPFTSTASWSTPRGLPRCPRWLSRGC
ncbi:hypothetical protein ACFPRL_27000 [Pseudoclavibacter helvolus]